MTDNFEQVHKDLVELKKEVTFIKHILSEEYELSTYAKKALKKARQRTGIEFIKN